MTTTPGKRKLPRRDIPYIGTTIQSFSFAKLPTNLKVLQRLHYETETNQGAASLPCVTVTILKELVNLWTHAGYGDILKSVSQILRQIQTLHLSYKSLLKIPTARRSGEALKKKEDTFLSTLPSLFDIAIQSKRWTATSYNTIG